MYISRSRLFKGKVRDNSGINGEIFSRQNELCITKPFLSCRNFLNFSVALFGSCFTFNTEYNQKKDEAAGKRVSSLTGPSFGLNLVLELDLFNYLKGNITKHVSNSLESLTIL